MYLMKYKSESFEKFKKFKNEVKKQTGKSIKKLRSDRSGEYLSTEFQGFLRDRGIILQMTPPYTAQLNEVSKRRNRTLLDMVRSMVSFTDLSASLWDMHFRQQCIFKIEFRLSLSKRHHMRYGIAKPQVSAI